jgi:hypothetical protein
LAAMSERESGREVSASAGALASKTSSLSVPKPSALPMAGVEVREARSRPLKGRRARGSVAAVRLPLDLSMPVRQLPPLARLERASLPRRLPSERRRIPELLSALGSGLGVSLEGEVSASSESGRSRSAGGSSGMSEGDGPDAL